MTVLFTELNRIIFTALYCTFSTSHGIEFTVNDLKIFYGLIPLSFKSVRVNFLALYPSAAAMMSLIRSCLSSSPAICSV